MNQSIFLSFGEIKHLLHDIVYGCTLKIWTFATKIMFILRSSITIKWMTFIIRYIDYFDIPTIYTYIMEVKYKILSYE